MNCRIFSTTLKIFAAAMVMSLSAGASAVFSAQAECAVTNYIISWNDPTTSSSTPWYNVYRYENRRGTSCIHGEGNAIGSTSGFTTIQKDKPHIVMQCPSNCSSTVPCVETSNFVTVYSSNCIPFGPTDQGPFEAAAYNQVVYLGSRDAMDNPEATIDARAIADHLDAVIAYHGYEFTDEVRERILLGAINAVQNWKQVQDNWKRHEPMPLYHRPKELPPEWVPADKQ